MFAGQFIGLIISQPISVYIGKKNMLFIGAGIVIGASILVAFTSDLYLLIISRFLVGIGSNINQVLVPLITAEIVPT